MSDLTEISQFFIDALEEYPSIRAEYHADPHGGFYTTSMFWDCSCDERHIQSNFQSYCPHCGDARKDAPDARIDEIVSDANHGKWLRNWYLQENNNA